MKNEERGQEGASCLSKVSVTLSETTITLLKGRHTLVRPSSAQPPAAAAVASSAQLLQSVPRGAEEVTSVAWGCESQLGGSSLTPGSVSSPPSAPPPAFQVGGQRVTLPAIPSEGVFLTPSGRFVQLQTAFGLRVRWDGDQQLYVRVPR